MNKKINFAVVGLGHIGKRHAAMITENPNAELVAYCDIKPQKELNVAESDVPFFSSIEEMLTSKIEIDVVNICTPNGLHAEQSIYVLEHNCHVVCEKPMALSKADAEKMIYKSLEKSRHIFGVMQNRYSPPSVWLKEVITQNILGNVFMVQLNCFWNRDERYYVKDTWHGDGKLDGGTLFTQFSHFIDIMYWLFGDIANINAHFNDFTHSDLTDFEDSGFVHFDFVNGGMGSLNYSTAVWDTNLESSITIIGENGTIKVAGQYMNEVVYCNIKDYQMPTLAPCNPPNDYGQYKGSAANHHFVIQNVVDTLLQKSTITTNAMEGLKIVDIIERIYADKNAR
ncbi:MAG: Gfo/Idh/MocA family oxidoreductase [Bacteroidales bacterium]|jgi:UDP-N-acetyl-2-amino-2-deoxyglucuronate dehydrogenase|nr:Gfo/Idh/MocA family oxidoreductase [Bacteroidales bacterium]